MNPGFAKFDDVPLSNQIDAFETVLADYDPDDQVQVRVWPEGNNPLASSPPDDRGFIIFEGVLARQSFRAQRDAASEDEGVRLVGVPMPVIDNRSSAAHHHRPLDARPDRHGRN